MLSYSAYRSHQILYASSEIEGCINEALEQDVTSMDIETESIILLKKTIPMTKLIDPLVAILQKVIIVGKASY